MVRSTVNGNDIFKQVDKNIPLVILIMAFSFAYKLLFNCLQIVIAFFDVGLLVKLRHEDLLALNLIEVNFIHF
jgi:hypothetical protein